MYFHGVGTAHPAYCYTQEECWRALQASDKLAELPARSSALLKRVLLSDNGIETRSLALQPLSQAFDLSPDALQERFLKNAPELAERAGRRALVQAGLAPPEIDAVIVSTCTGYLCPGLTSYVSERIGLRPEALALDLVGQGCGAAIPNLRMAESLVRSKGARYVLSICVEVCSAAFYLDEDPGVLISACLFGDGAGAAVLSEQPRADGPSVRWLGSGTRLSPENRDYLKFEERGGMLRNILCKQVPDLAGKYSKVVLGDVLAQFGLPKHQIRAWILHAGGRDILLKLKEHLDLQPEDLAWSASILRRFGNLSSASVLFVLDAALRGKSCGGYWWMTSFGAGFSCHGALIQVDMNR